ncbi:MAG: 5-(carboxyamino)imidazole ribonucleotide synthase [Pseudomonadota bacterium]
MSLAPGSAVGIIGGGQLGRMLAMAALRLGLRVHVYAPPEADNVAFAAAHHAVEGAYDDRLALKRFAAGVDVLTYEFENVPPTVFDGIATPVRPSPLALATAQDRLPEKAFLAACGLATARYAAIHSVDELDRVREAIPKGFLKTRRLGYDGKGQVRVDGAMASRDALDTIGNAPAIFEEAIPFTDETSVVLVRTEAGDLASYAPSRNEHEGGILRRTSFPGPLNPEFEAVARRWTANVAEALSYVGVLAVEYFVTEDPERPLIANEMAPRVHNTGHWTMDGALTSQFENHIRAICGWPLGSTSRTAEVTMVNLLGEEASDVAGHLHNRLARAHIYGKRTARPGRKMGHVNFLTRTVDFDTDRW